MVDSLSFTTSILISFCAYYVTLNKAPKNSSHKQDEPGKESRPLRSAGPTNPPPPISHTAPPTFIVPLCQQQRAKVMSGQEVSGHVHQVNPSRVSSWGHTSAPRPCLASLTGLDGFLSQGEKRFLTNDGGAVLYGAAPAPVPHVFPSPSQVLRQNQICQNTVLVSFFSRLLQVLLCCPECSDLWAASAYTPPHLPNRSFYYFRETHNQSPSSSFLPIWFLPGLCQYHFFITSAASVNMSLCLWGYVIKNTFKK